MKLNRPLTIAFWRLLLCLMLGLSLSAAQADQLLAPQLVIQDTSDTLQKNLQQDEYKQDFLKATQFVDKTIDPHVDFNRVSALVLGKYWKTANDARKSASGRNSKRCWFAPTPRHSPNTPIGPSATCP